MAISWKTEQLRFTVFFHQTTPPNLESWWQSVHGELPDSVQKKPRENVVQVTGPTALGNQLLQYAPGRADWLCAPPTNQIQPETVLSIGDFSDVAQQYASSIGQWVKALDDTTYRVAFGARLVSEVDSIAHGRRKLSEYLGAVEVMDSDLDFIYQVNRRQESDSIPGSEINRLSNWSFGQAQLIQFNNANLQQSIAAKTTPILNLHLDINNVPSEGNKPLPAEHLTNLFDELTSKAISISVNGVPA